jgi:hypothetical protein
MNVLFSSLHFAKIIKALLYPKNFLTVYIDYLVTKKAVTISSLNHTCYKDRFMGSRRIKPGGAF